MLARGTQFGTYEVLELLGTGGFGDVFRARDSRLGRDVAVKVLPRAFSDDADRYARFAREARLLAGIRTFRERNRYHLHWPVVGAGVLVLFAAALYSSRRRQRG